MRITFSPQHPRCMRANLSTPEALSYSQNLSRICASTVPLAIFSAPNSIVSPPMLPKILWRSVSGIHITHHKPTEMIISIQPGSTIDSKNPQSLSSTSPNTESEKKKQQKDQRKAHYASLSGNGTSNGENISAFIETMRSCCRNGKRRLT